MSAEHELKCIIQHQQMPFWDRFETISILHKKIESITKLLLFFLSKWIFFPISDDYNSNCTRWGVEDLIHKLEIIPSSHPWLDPLNLSVVCQTRVWYALFPLLPELIFLSPIPLFLHMVRSLGESHVSSHGTVPGRAKLVSSFVPWFVLFSLLALLLVQSLLWWV